MRDGLHLNAGSAFYVILGTGDMSNQGKWEVVNSSKPNKKSKDGKAGGGKNKKSFIENAPRIEVAPPVKESSTIYQVFNADGKGPATDAKPRGADQSKPANGSGGGAAKKNVSKPSPKSNKGNKRQPQTLEEAMKSIEVADLQTILANDQQTFPSNPSIWLKDLASMLILRLEKVPESDPVFADFPPDYPLKLLPKPAHNLLKETLMQCSSSTLEVFLEHCVQTCINDIGKGTSTYGSRIFIQLLAINKPDVITSNLPKYLELVKSQQNHPLRCLSILWAVGQVRQKDFSHGLKVWLEVMLPVLNMRALSGYAIDYLAQIFDSCKDLKAAYNIISVRNFFHTLDFVFKKELNLASNQQKKLLSVYPKFKVAAFGGNKETTLRNFFPSFLARLGDGKNAALEKEVLDCLVDCLCFDKHCFSLWRQMYTKHLRQSRILLQHLNNNWRSVRSRIDRKILKETMSSFNVTSEELSQEKKRQEGLNECMEACKELSQKMNRTYFPWKTLVLLLFAVIGGVIAYDSYSHGGFKKSTTAQFLQQIGILAFLEQVWLRACIYTGKALDWLFENVPVYYGKISALVGPYLRLFWTKLYAAGIHLEEITRPQRLYLMERTHFFLEWIYEKTPWLWEEVSHYASIGWEYVVFAVRFAWNHILTASLIIRTWIQENLLTDKEAARL